MSRKTSTPASTGPQAGTAVAFRREGLAPTLLALAAALGGCAMQATSPERLPLLEAQGLQMAPVEGAAPAASAASTPAVTPAVTAAVTPAPWPRQDWWQALGDPQLDALIADALAHGLEPLVAEARLRQARAQAGLEQSGLSPQLSARAGWQGERQSSQAEPASQGAGQFSRRWEGGLALDWTPDLWGGRRAAWNAALGQVRMAELTARDARIQLTVAVAQAYVQLAYAHLQGDIAKAEQERVAEVQRLTRQRVGSGLGTQAQLRQTDSDMASAAQQRLMAERLVSAAQGTLSVLLGQGPGRGAALGRPVLPAGTPLLAPAWLPLDLLGRRADVVAARWRVESARQRVGSARA
ncbi:MAG TPA: TolC family protein, partial [Burkholderiaceae bacterium]|nr:TolC family protein [Burkholderiaceae bacterium]